MTFAATCVEAQLARLPVIESLVVEPAVPVAGTPFTIKCIVGTGYGLLGPRVEVGDGVISIHFGFGRLAWIGPFPLPVQIPPVMAGIYLVRVIVWTDAYEGRVFERKPWTIATTVVRVQPRTRRRTVSR